MRITVWSTFISEMNPLLEGMSDENRSTAEGDGDNELVVTVEIKLADVTYGGTSAYLSTPTPPSADYLFVSFYLNSTYHLPLWPPRYQRKYHALAAKSSLDRRHNPNTWHAKAQPPGIQHSTHSLPPFLFNISSSMHRLSTQPPKPGFFFFFFLFSRDLHATSSLCTKTHGQR